MKLIDNRQKEQIQLRAEKTRFTKRLFYSKGKGKAALPPTTPPAAKETEREKAPAAKVEPYHAQTKVGRNDPCPCGSKKKYKKCCLLKSESPPNAV